MTIFDNEYVINSSQPMNCREHLFNISLEADAKPGDYRLQVLYSFVDEKDIKYLELGHVSVTAAVLSECSFFDGLCRWKSSGSSGSLWDTGGGIQPLK